MGEHALQRLWRWPIWWWRIRWWWIPGWRRVSPLMFTEVKPRTSMRFTFGGMRMSHAVRNKVLASHLPWFVAVLAVLTLQVSCSKPEKPTADKAVQKTFASPADTGGAFVEAAKSGDQAVLLAIFGPDAEAVLFSGDAVKDKDALQDFVAAYNQMHRWREIKVGGEMLYTGADNFSFPIPLAQNSSGQWEFDT